MFARLNFPLARFPLIKKFNKIIFLVTQAILYYIEKVVKLPIFPETGKLSIERTLLALDINNLQGLAFLSEQKYTRE